MGSTRPNWVGLDLCDGLGWVEFFLTHYGELGEKIPSTRPNPIHAHPYWSVRPVFFPVRNMGGYMYRFTCRYGIYQPYQPVQYGIDFLALNYFISPNMKI